MTVTFDGPIDVTVEDEDGKQSCPECGKAVTARGLTRHLNSAHGANIAPRTSGDGSGKPRAKRGRKTKGLSQEVSDGLTSISSKLLIMLTMFYAWWALRRAEVPDASGDIADQLAMTDDEAIAIGRVVARMFASTEPGRRLAPVIVENEDMLDALFAGFDYVKRSRQVWDELETRGYITKQPQQEVTAHGTNGQVAKGRASSEATGGPEYIPPSAVDLIAGG